MDRLTKALLAIIATLLLVLVVEVGAMGLQLKRETTELNAKLSSQSEVVSSRAQTTLDAVETRQRSFSRNLSHVASQTEKDVANIEKRLAGLQSTSGGLLKKMGQVVQLNQLMADEMLVLIRQMTGLQQAMAAAVKPIDLQGSEGVGGSGDPKK
jgi:hypothetical protein